MPEYHLGKMIKQLRKQKGITQEELAEGLLSQSNLARVELGLQVPQKLTLDSLLQRLGADPQHVHYYYSSEKDFELSQKRKLISKLSENNRISEMEELLASLEKEPEYSEGLNLQFVLLSKADAALYKLINGDSNISTGDIRRLLGEAIEISIPGYSEKYITDYLLSHLEINIINLFSILYSREGDLDKAIQIQFALRDRLESIALDETSKMIQLPMIYYNLTKYLGLACRYNEAIENCDKAIKVCILNTNLEYIPRIIFNKVCCLYELGDFRACKSLLHQSYWGSYMIQRYKDAEQIKNYAKEKLDIVFYEN